MKKTNLSSNLFLSVTIVEVIWPMTGMRSQNIRLSDWAIRIFPQKKVNYLIETLSVEK
jgi:hypothetical protein